MEGMAPRMAGRAVAAGYAGRKAEMKIPSLYLKVECLAGTVIDDAAKELVALADRVGVTCVMQFNGLELRARPRDTAESIVQRYWTSNCGRLRIIKAEP